MDGIESIGMPSALSSLSQEPAEVALLSRGEGRTRLAELARGSDAEKQQLAKDFESVFLTKLFDQVKESIGATGFEEDPASEQVQGMFWSYLAQDVADKGGFGMWRDIYQHFKDMEGAQAPGELINKEL